MVRLIDKVVHNATEMPTMEATRAEREEVVMMSITPFTSSGNHNWGNDQQYMEITSSPRRRTRIDQGLD